MKQKRMVLPRSSLFVALLVVLLASIVACHREYGGNAKNPEVTAHTTYSGTINGSPVSIDVVATIDTARGGRSSCTFTKLPSGFNPATLGTMA